MKPVSKLPLLSGPGPEPVSAAPKIRFWAFADVARLDLTRLLVAFLALVGTGVVSVDAWILDRGGASGQR